MGNTTTKSDLTRYALWLGIAATAAANRQHYQMTTTWLPHLASNTVSLLLPDVYRLVDRVMPPAPELPADLSTLRATFDALIRDNPRYAAYVAPLAAGYLTSHPQFNIYKGRMGELQLAGFGLDAIPHSATAFALSKLIHATLAEAARHARHTTFGRLIGWASQRPRMISGATLALVSIVWEVNEYLVHRQELAEKGSIEAINMQWSPGDTATDVLANAAGWAAAAVLDNHK